MRRKMRDRLALHMSTLDTTPLAEALAAVKRAGWNAIELRRVDFTRCVATGMASAQVLDLVRASGLAVACVGTETGLLFATGHELERLLGVLDETCACAVALGCDLVMVSPGTFPAGTIEQAAVNLRAGGEIARRHGVRLASEFVSIHPVLNSLEVGLAIVERAAHESCGLLLDAYHLEYTGRGGRGFVECPADKVFAFQFSDVPAVLLPGMKRPLDRLVPGTGRVRWADVFQLLDEKGYQGYLSYEAPNPDTWNRPADEVAREAVEATRALLAGVE